MKQKRRLLGIAPILLGLVLFLSACGFEEPDPYVSMSEEPDLYVSMNEEPDLYVSMNEWQELEDWGIKVTDVEYLDIFDIEGSDRYFVPRDGFRFLIVHLSVRNYSDEAQIFAPYAHTVGTLHIAMDIGEERHWVPSSMRLVVDGIARSRSDILNTEVAPDEMVEGIVGFEIRITTLENLELPLDLHITYFTIIDSQTVRERLVFDLRDA